MATGIRYPADLQRPDRGGFGDTFEEIRTEVPMEVGAPRVRNRMRSAPRIFDVRWTFSQTEFTLFDNWWQYTIKGGASEFDIQLLDDDQTLVWFTVRALGDFKAEVVNELEWLVTLRLRALSDNFGTTRAAGTDELRGRSTPGVNASGNLLVYSPIRGSTSVGISAATARPKTLPFMGKSTPGLYSLPRAKFAPFPLRGQITIGVSAATGYLEIGTVGYYPELSRQWMDADWFGTGAAQDINTLAEVTEREWMEV